MNFEDHGLPLVQLKEQRREMVMALVGNNDPMPSGQIAEIAFIQHTIAAMEAVIVDLDAKIAVPLQGKGRLRRVLDCSAFLD